MMKSNQYNGIDIMKFLMSLVVVAIHVHPFDDVNCTFFRNGWGGGN